MFLTTIDKVQMICEVTLEYDSTYLNIQIIQCVKIKSISKYGGKISNQKESKHSSAQKLLEILFKI